LCVEGHGRGASPAREVDEEHPGGRRRACLLQSKPFATSGAPDPSCAAPVATLPAVAQSTPWATMWKAPWLLGTDVNEASAHCLPASLLAVTAEDVPGDARFPVPDEQLQVPMTAIIVSNRQNVRTPIGLTAWLLIGGTRPKGIPTPTTANAMPEMVDHTEVRKGRARDPLRPTLVRGRGC
jgi:hypothetical protein